MQKTMRDIFILEYTKAVATRKNPFEAADAFFDSLKENGYSLLPKRDAD